MCFLIKLKHRITELNMKDKILDVNEKICLRVVYCHKETGKEYDFMIKVGLFEDVINISEKTMVSIATFHSYLDKGSDSEDEEIENSEEILNSYELIQIKFVPQCEGCWWDCPGQRDHMQSPYGCLYEPEFIPNTPEDKNA